MRTSPTFPFPPRFLAWNHRVGWLLVLLSACGHEQPAVPADGGGPDAAVVDSAAGDTMASADSATDAATCPRLPAPADRARRVVVSHPYDSSSQPSGRFEVLTLSSAGELSRDGTIVELGPTFTGEMVFTPDGRVGIVTEDDGTLGVIGIEESGAAHVIHASFAGSFYAMSVVMAADGAHAYVLDGNWRDNGGGVFVVDIGCDGTLTERGLLAVGHVPRGLIELPNGNLIVAARNLLDAASGPDVYLLRQTQPPAILASADLFPDDSQIVSTAVLTADGRYAVIADNDAYPPQGITNRLGIVEVLAGGFGQVQTIAPLDDPYAVVASPYGSPLVVVSGFGNAIYLVDYTPSNAATPFQLRGELTYNGAAPQLPGPAVAIRRGALTGRVLVAETTALRQIDLAADGSATDRGLFSMGSGSAVILGALGIQP